jgi:hypothetical protein
MSLSDDALVDGALIQVERDRPAGALAQLPVGAPDVGAQCPGQVRLVEVVELGDDAGRRVPGRQQLRCRAGALDLPDHDPGPDEPVEQGLGVVGPGVSQRVPSSRNVRWVAPGSPMPPSTSAGVGTARKEVPTPNSVPVNVAPSGTGAVLVRVSGPVMPAYARPACSQNTRPQRTPATDVIAVTRSLAQVHTVSTHGESDPRVSNRSPTREQQVRV